MQYFEVKQITRFTVGQGPQLNDKRSFIKFMFLGIKSSVNFDFFKTLPYFHENLLNRL